MTRLRQRDFAAFSQALETLYADTSSATLSDRILATLRALFDCDFASFSLMDLRRGLFHSVNLAPLVPDWPGTETHQRHLHADPAAVYIMRTRAPGALKISDFVSLREYHSSSVYTEVFQRVGCDRRLGFAVNDGSPVSLIATLNRKRQDFSEGDRALLDLLRPHLLQANAHAHADQQARTGYQRELTRLGDTLEVGLGEIDDAGRIHWLTPRAQVLLGTFFPGPSHWSSPGSLPGAVGTQLAPTLRRSQAPPVLDFSAPPPFVWRFAGPAGRTLRLRLVAARPKRWHMLLDESRRAMSMQTFLQERNLTAREGEILQWLKQGKSNSAIAIILGVTEKTVGKHLEHIFAKLEVENRTSAARMVTDALGA